MVVDYSYLFFLISRDHLGIIFYDFYVFIDFEIYIVLSFFMTLFFEFTISGPNAYIEDQGWPVQRSLPSPLLLATITIGT